MFHISDNAYIRNLEIQECLIENARYRSSGWGGVLTSE